MSVISSANTDPTTSRRGEDIHPHIRYSHLDSIYHAYLHPHAQIWTTRLEDARLLWTSYLSIYLFAYPGFSRIQKWHNAHPPPPVLLKTLNRSFIIMARVRRYPNHLIYLLASAFASRCCRWTGSHCLFNCDDIPPYSSFASSSLFSFGLCVKLAPSCFICVEQSKIVSTVFIHISIR